MKVAHVAPGKGFAAADGYRRGRLPVASRVEGASVLVRQGDLARPPPRVDHDVDFRDLRHGRPMPEATRDGRWKSDQVRLDRRPVRLELPAHVRQDLVGARRAQHARDLSRRGKDHHVEEHVRVVAVIASMQGEVKGRRRHGRSSLWPSGSDLVDRHLEVARSGRKRRPQG